MPSKSTTTPTDDAVRNRAYLMWEADGRPDGFAEHYWGAASAALLSEVAAAKPKRAAAKAEVPTRKAKPSVAKAAKDGPVAKGKKKS